MKYLIRLACFYLIYSCSPTRIVTDYDHQQNFSRFKTFDFYPEMNSGLSELDQKRVLSISESLLVSKGITRNQNADLYLNFKTILDNQSARNAIGVGVGSGGRGINIGFGGSIPVVISSTKLKITIDLIDVKKDDLVWQAIVNRKFNPNMSPNTKMHFFEEVLQKAFALFPPK